MAILNPARRTCKKGVLTRLRSPLQAQIIWLKMPWNVPEERFSFGVRPCLQGYRCLLLITRNSNFLNEDNRNKYRI
ncbi:MULTISPECIES: hypothetical protein [Methanosarcina]|uniref:Uncharacterized protein n=3 Tax=Methanosarcina mazei TaxID=2209 RepID=A0A0E3RR85_METMZ|nr:MULTISPECIES: hypothetical protein [Methanosarcina]AAM29925.1 hypothetical protein MM_0229 [Methanosarcina mazei Go1]AKB61003.1 hypothetical protein MSMAP_1018 [Methanosarcina mazei SarPi]AKB67625.1 hypothetical protein MSMAL_1082 [Methanosarcina mazei LYC]WIM46958.1 hypothetical protein PQQ20_01330 [Methanosarcina mazei]